LFLMSFEVDKEGEKTAISQLTMPFLPKNDDMSRTDRKNMYKIVHFYVEFGL